ncbi:chemotaxis protein CheD [Lederbergia lenta]|uniref:Probable chemoreceptor glutamine deamidase CheD n=1 Tax=Lederbergia lenta TaxID=1467 RepID=A0A2X4WRG3_LEDLE|nr:chemotaxis protein CheD [Lederbergia lenta]MEC2324302.1 chemotaxis protein CheD [Lederbergia lenta]SQI60210.1 CheD protein [Lederbergia lenta]
MSETVIRVGIADMKIVQAPNKIRTLGLGSCVGVIIYDPNKKMAGMAHIMLPDSSLAKGNKAMNVAKFADTAIKALTKELITLGANRSNLKAKISGGAQMFQFSSKNEQMRIGPRNVEAVKKELQKLNIQLISEDTGGNSGRTIEFNPDSLALQINTVYQDQVVI